MGIKMVGNGVVPFPCGSGRRKMSSQTRNIVIFGSERGKTLFQTREGNEKQETAVEERNTDSDRGIQKIVGNQMFNHAGV